MSVLKSVAIFSDILNYDFFILLSCYYATKAPIRTIVLTDLKTEGFAIASRQEQLDWAHCELILQQLGRLHATSMVLAKRVSISEIIILHYYYWTETNKILTISYFPNNADRQCERLDIYFV